MATNNAWNSNIPVEISKGGTNATTMATSTGIVKYDGTSLVTSSTALIDSSNRYTNTSQPLFIAYRNTAAGSVTGAGSDYTLTFDVEDVDQGGNFDATTGIFTAPVTGNYMFNATVTMTGLTSVHTLAILQAVVFAGRVYSMRWNPFAISTSGTCSFNHSLLVPMVGGTQTCFYQLTVAGSGANDVSVAGGRQTWIGGYLVA